MTSLTFMVHELEVCMMDHTTLVSNIVHIATSLSSSDFTNCKEMYKNNEDLSCML